MTKCIFTYLKSSPYPCCLKEEIWSCLCLYLVMFLSPNYFDILKKKSGVHHDKLRNTGGGNWLGQHPIAAAAKCIKLMRPRLRRLWLIRNLPSDSHVLCAAWQFFLFVSWATKNLPGKRFPSILPSTGLGVQGANVLEPKSLTFTLHQSINGIILPLVSSFCVAVVGSVLFKMKGNSKELE